MNYRQLQEQLKSLKKSGRKVNCKLNAKKEVLQAEYDRLLLGEQYIVFKYVKTGKGDSTFYWTGKHWSRFEDKAHKFTTLVDASEFTFAKKLDGLTRVYFNRIS